MLEAGSRAGPGQSNPDDLPSASASIYQRNAAAAVVRRRTEGKVLQVEEPAEAHSCRRTWE